MLVSYNRLLQNIEKITEELKEIEKTSSHYMQKLIKMYEDLQYKIYTYVEIFSIFYAIERLEEEKKCESKTSVLDDYRILLDKLSQKGETLSDLYNELLQQKSHFESYYPEDYRINSKMNSSDRCVNYYDEVDKFELGYEELVDEYNLYERDDDYDDNSYYDDYDFKIDYLEHECDCCQKKIEAGDEFISCDDFSKLLNVVFSEILENKNWTKCNKCLNIEGIIENSIISEEFKLRHIIKISNFFEEFDLGKLERYNDFSSVECIGCKKNFDLKDGMLYRETELDFGKFNKWLDPNKQVKSHSEFILFLNYLSNNPLLGYRHKVGNELYELFEKRYETSEVLSKGKVLYRGRKKQNKYEIYTACSLWNPPRNVTPHGRFNEVGTSNLYLSSSIQSIAEEVNCKKNENLILAKFIVLKDLKILDLSEGLSEFGKYLSIATSQDSSIYFNEYNFTNYIAAICKDIGYGGIKYKGVRNNRDYFNYVLFNFEKNIDLRIDYVVPFNCVSKRGIKFTHSKKTSKYTIVVPNKIRFTYNKLLGRYKKIY